MKVFSKGIIPFLLSAALFYALFPGLVGFKLSPMFVTSWFLSDPVVSYLNFIPSIDVIRYELFENHNFLWSNLRGMGLPLLGNEIQAGPLFPLTLALIWLPDDVFWNVFVFLRVVLTGMGTYLVARDFLKLRPMAALFFTFSFAYAFYVMRWMNHPWQNGYLAGIWYLYFLVAVARQSMERFAGKRFFFLLGLIVAIYSMVTCGFPETAAFWGIVVVLVYAPFIGTLLVKKQLTVSAFLLDVVIAHMIGFALASYQIFAIIELLQTRTGSRTAVGLSQFPLEQLLSFFSLSLSNITASEPVVFSRSQTSLGLVPGVLFFFGIFHWLKNIKRTSYVEAGALFCLVFFICKMFPLWPWLNTFVGSLPVLAESRFRSYFFFCLLWFFAYFVARGLDMFFAEEEHISRRLKFAFLFSSVICVTALLIHSLVVLKISFVSILTEPGYGEARKVIYAFLLGLAVITALLWRKPRSWPVLTGGLLVLLLLSVVEQRLISPASFNASSYNTYTAKILDEILEKNGVSRIDYRGRDAGGAFTGIGVATLNTGAPPILPERGLVYRNSLFVSDFAGLLPLKRGIYKHSWQTSSAAIFASDFFLDAEYRGLPVWKDLEKKEGGNIAVGRVMFFSQMLKKGHTILPRRVGLKNMVSGWAFDPESADLNGTATYVVLKHDNGEIVAPARREYRPDVAKVFGNKAYRRAGFKVYFDRRLLHPGEYTLLVRFLREGDSSYFEHDTGYSFTVRENAGRKDSADEKRQYLGQVDGKYFYKDPSILPRAFIAGRCIPVENMKQAARRLKSERTYRTGDVYLEELSEKESTLCKSFSGSPQGIEIVRDTGSIVETTDFMGPAVLVLNDNYYTGWRAHDVRSGEEVEIKPANIAVRAVVLPEKKNYSIRFVYHPPWLWYARAIVAFSVILLGSLVVAAFGRGRSSPEC